jgi:prefoldin subunit 5
MHGVPSMRILDYVERTADNAPKTLEKHECQCGKDFVRKEDFDALQNEINALRSELEELKAKSKAKTAKKAVEEVEDDE